MGGAGAGAAAADSEIPPVFAPPTETAPELAAAVPAFAAFASFAPSFFFDFPSIR